MIGAVAVQNKPFELWIKGKFVFYIILEQNFREETIGLSQKYFPSMQSVVPTFAYKRCIKFKYTSTIAYCILIDMLSN